MLVLEKKNPVAMTEAERDELWRFFSPIVSRPRDRFERALEAFPEIHCWRKEPDDTLVGFTATRFLTVDLGGTPVTVLYIGWAAIAKELRGNALPVRHIYWQAVVEWLKSPWRPFYVVFCASTSKSYRSLIRYIPQCWPHPDSETPALIKDLFAALMSALGEDGYDAASGVLKRFGTSRYKEGVVADAPETAQDPAIAFYAMRNPAQHEGDTLPVAIPVRMMNLVGIGLRLLRRRPARKTPTLVNAGPNLLERK
jgi:hypothetical protein